MRSLKLSAAVGDVRHQSAYIVINGPGHDGTRLVLREGITSFGRLPSNDVILLGDLVSRHHTRITFFEGRATIQDLGSHNGSWVNGEKVTTRVLKDGDICRVGNFRLSFHPGVMPSVNGQPTNEDTTNAELGGSQNHTDIENTSSSVGRVPSQSVLIHQIEMARAGEGAQAKAMQVLLRASDALASATDVASYMQEMLRLALDQSGAATAAFVKHDPKTRNNEVTATRTAQRSQQRPHVAMNVIEWTVTKNFALLVDDIKSDLRFDREPIQGPLAVLSVPVAEDDRVLGAMYLSRSAPPFHDGDLDALSAIAHLMSTALTRARFITEQSRSNADVLERLSSPDIAQVLREQLDSETPQGLEGKRATIIVADIPGLSGLSERVSPLDVTGFLSAFLDGAHEIATRYQGALRTMTGSRIAMFFGLPRSYGEDAVRAAGAAIELQVMVERVATAFTGLGQQRLRAGISSGWLLAGPVGTQRRLTYAVLGDTADFAGQLEQSAAAGAILIEETTAQLVANRFELRNLGNQQVRGRADPHPLYQIVRAKRR